MDYLIVEVDQGIATLTLNDPEKRNAINLQMNDEIVETMEQLENSGEANVVIVTGMPPAFCAGADLSDLLEARERDNIHDIYRGFLRVAHSPLPTIAAVNGAAVGAGMNMALGCDVIIAAESAKFDSRFLQIGIHPGGGHTWRLRHKTSDQTTRAMVLFGEPLKGPRAAEVGLAWRCVPDDELMASCSKWRAVQPRIQRSCNAQPRLRCSSSPALTPRLTAVEHEVGPQLTSMASPEFQELVAKLQASISSKE